MVEYVYLPVVTLMDVDGLWTIIHPDTVTTSYQSCLLNSKAWLKEFMSTGQFQIGVNYCVEILDTRGL